MYRLKIKKKLRKTQFSESLVIEPRGNYQCLFNKLTNNFCQHQYCQNLRHRYYVFDSVILLSKSTQL